MAGMKDSITTPGDYLRDEENATPVIQELSVEASVIFISNAGQSVYTTFLALYSASKYRIVPGERDSFLDIVTVRGRIRIMEL